MSVDVLISLDEIKAREGAKMKLWEEIVEFLLVKPLLLLPKGLIKISFA